MIVHLEDTDGKRSAITVPAEALTAAHSTPTRDSHAGAVDLVTATNALAATLYG